MGGIPEQRNGSPEFHDDATDAAHGLKSSPQILPVAPMESSLLVPEQLVDPAVVLPPLPTLPDDPDEHPNWYDIYREHVTLYRAAAELRKAVADAAKSEIELADYRRRDADARAKPAALCTPSTPEWMRIASGRRSTRCRPGRAATPAPR